MGTESEEHREGLAPEQAVAKAAILAECDKLWAAGIKFVAIHFDGYGDDGGTEDAKCYTGDGYAWCEHDPVHYDTR